LHTEDTLYQTSHDVAKTTPLIICSNSSCVCGTTRCILKREYICNAPLVLQLWQASTLLPMATS
jgi:hypothetical protein